MLLCVAYMPTWMLISTLHHGCCCRQILCTMPTLLLRKKCTTCNAHRCFQSRTGSQG